MLRRDPQCQNEFLKSRLPQLVGPTLEETNVEKNSMGPLGKKNAGPKPQQYCQIHAEPLENIAPRLRNHCKKCLIPQKQHKHSKPEPLKTFHKKSPLEAAQTDPHIHSRNGPGMGIKKLLKKLVRVSEMPPKLRNLRVSKKSGFLIILSGCIGI